jgi:hypothetical protein
MSRYAASSYLNYGRGFHHVYILRSQITVASLRYYSHIYLAEPSRSTCVQLNFFHFHQALSEYSSWKFYVCLYALVAIARMIRSFW